MDFVHIKKFEDIFNRKFKTVKALSDIGIEFENKNIVHYILFSTSDVFSFDIRKKRWLTKNKHKAEIEKKIRLSVQGEYKAPKQNE